MSNGRIRLVALSGVTGISFTAIFVRLADIDPVGIAFFRGLYALPILAAMWWWRRSADGRPTRSRLLAMAAGGFLALDLATWHIAIEQIGAGLATVLVNTQVVFVAAAAWLVYGERPSARTLRIVPVVFAGVVLISGLGRDDAYGANPWAGVGLALVAGVFYALFLLVLRHSNRSHLAPAAGPLFDATIGLTVASLVVGLVLFDDFTLDVTWPAHGWILLLAVVCQSVGWLLITFALPRMAALETSVIVLAQPMMTLIWARLIFTETLSIVQCAGVAVVLMGLLLLNRSGVLAPRREHADTRSDVFEPVREDP